MVHKGLTMTNSRTRKDYRRALVYIAGYHEYHSNTPSIGGLLRAARRHGVRIPRRLKHIPSAKFWADEVREALNNPNLVAITVTL